MKHMRSEEEMMEEILGFARSDGGILAVTMNGSRADPGSIPDEYSDFDIQYIVKDIRRFVSDKEWIRRFGEMLIMQEPDDWHSHPYKMSSREPYAFLMQFTDGNRIDLTLHDVANMERFYQDKEPRRVLLVKNKGMRIDENKDTKEFLIPRPSEKEFQCIVNEFLWLALYVHKGIKRRELCYAKSYMDQCEIEMLCKMLSWKLGVGHDFSVSAGKSYRRFAHFLTSDEMNELAKVYSTGEFSDIEEKLLYALEYFGRTAAYVADKLHFIFDSGQVDDIRRYILDRRVGKQFSAK